MEIAANFDMQSINGVKAIFWLREKLMRTAPSAPRKPQGILEENDQVKIGWTLEAAALGPALTRFAQETRAVATDEQARIKFRRYWRWARFGIIAIRLLMMPAVRRAAERRWTREMGEKNPRPLGRG